MGATFIYVADQTQESFDLKVALAEAGFPTVHVGSAKAAEELSTHRGKLPILFESEFFNEMEPLKQRFITIERVRGRDFDELVADLKKFV